MDLENFDSKVKFLTGVSNILSKIDNNIERDMYIDKISKKYGMSPGPILKEVERGMSKKSNNDIIIDMQSLNKKMQLVTNVRKRQEQYIVALLLSKKPSIQQEIVKNIKSSDIDNEDVKKIFDFILSLMDNYDINKIDILSKIHDEDMVKEITDIMYIDISGYEEKLLQDVLKNKRKEKLYARRDEILKRLDQNISKDESEIIKYELNQIVIELSKLK